MAQTLITKMTGTTNSENTGFEDGKELGRTTIASNFTMEMNEEISEEKISAGFSIEMNSSADICGEVLNQSQLIEGKMVISRNEFSLKASEYGVNMILSMSSKDDIVDFLMTQSDCFTLTNNKGESIIIDIKAEVDGQSIFEIFNP